MPGPAIFLLHINDLPDDAVCNIAVYAVGTTFYCKSDQVLNLHYGLLQEVVCSFQGRNISPCFNSLAKWLCYYSCENRWICF